MSINRISNVSFGYAMTPKFKERIVIGGKRRGMDTEKILNDFSNTGSDSITLDRRRVKEPGSFLVRHSKDIMVFPKKYNHYEVIDNPFIENLKDVEKDGIEEILYKAIENGKLNKVAAELLDDFPDMVETIDSIREKSINQEENLENANKSIFRRYWDSIIEY